MMIDALLHSKLTSQQENMEDILTSNVFGMLQYVPPEIGLFRFLARARTAETKDKHEYPMQNLSGGPDAVEYRFWPTWRKREPDVELYIQSNVSDSYLVGIEAKYNSGKSSEADDVEQETDEGVSRECTDQLVREWIELVDEAAGRNAKPILIYLTADFGFPIQQIRASLDEHPRKHPNSPRPRICWLSWRELADLFGNAPKRSILLAIAEMAKKMGLTFFRGITKVARISITWRFAEPFQQVLQTSHTHSLRQAWQFQVAPITSQWRFQANGPG